MADPTDTEKVMDQLANPNLRAKFNGSMDIYYLYRSFLITMHQRIKSARSSLVSGLNLVSFGDYAMKDWNHSLSHLNVIHMGKSNKEYPLK